jgi:hypothetical protein
MTERDLKAQTTTLMEWVGDQYRLTGQFVLSIKTAETIRDKTIRLIEPTYMRARAYVKAKRTGKGGAAAAKGGHAVIRQIQEWLCELED